MTETGTETQGVENGARPGDSAGGDRIDGWRAIAAHFDRDRATVIRWASDRGMPVHRMPGGRSGTVYALRHELDHWAGRGVRPGMATPEVAAPIPAPDPAAPVTPSPQPRRRRTMAIAAALLVVALPAGWAVRQSLTSDGTRAPIPLPADPAAAHDFLTARDLVADREATGLERAIALFERVVARAPDYAPGHAGLAEALLLSREFGMRSDADAFARARIAAHAAVRLGADLASGYRLTGFIAYWADHDFVEADAMLRRALAIDPDDATTHFWYGNILSDHGDHRAARAALDRARLMQPGSVAIQTDLAWARWAAGDDAGATRVLDDIARRHPDFAVAHDCLAILAFARSDAAGYVAHAMRFARLRRDPVLIEQAQAAQTALADGGVAAFRTTVLRQAMTAMATDSGRTHAWPAFVASTNGDRAALLAILQRATRRREHWGDAGLALRIQRRWNGDRAVTAPLARLRAV